ncbi:MAG: ribosomal protein S18-alanine N-acetyltransferase [Candidatus Krumholzibacteriales bacterium]
MRIKVREATEGDISDILRIESESFEIPWPEAMFRNQLELRPVTLLLIAETASSVIGYSVVWFEGPDSHILNIAVDPELRRRGVAGRMVDEIIRISRERGCGRLYLEVRENNIPARDFYLERGFRMTGTIEGYYRDSGEDALFLELSLR